MRCKVNTEVKDLMIKVYLHIVCMMHVEKVIYELELLALVISCASLISNNQARSNLQS